MRYLLLIYIDESHYQGMDEAAGQAETQTWMEYTQALTDAGVSSGGDALQPVATATAVRNHDGNGPLVTDGPFAETKEQLGGYYALDVPNLDVAIEWASKCPGARFGTVELRPIQEYDQG
jgi:hypothetical protein